MSSVKQSSISTRSQNFNFQNLQPITYLKTFNKMLQHISKPSVQLLQSSKQLKTVRLSKFPLHSYYEQMQGILEGGGKRLNQTQKVNKKEAQLEKLQEKFLNKHYTFVKGALQKIIQDNQSQQNLLLKSKKFYQTNQLKRTGIDYQAQIANMVRLRSQPKLRSIKTTIDSARKTLQESTSKVSNYNSVHTLNNTSLPKRKHTKNDSQRSMESNRLNDRKTSNQQSTKDTKTQYFSLKNGETNKNKNSLSDYHSINNEEEHNPIFKKLKQPQKVQRFRKRNDKEIDFLLTSRKTFHQPKLKKSFQSIHPMTQRKHIQISEKPESIKALGLNKNSGNQIKNFKLKYKNTLRQKIFEDEENERQRSLNSEELNEFRKQFSHKNHRRRKSDSIQKDSFRDQFSDEDQNFIKQVQFLQRKQAKRQQQYATLVEGKVKQVKEKLNQKIKQVKKFDYSAPKESPKNPKNKRELN